MISDDIFTIRRLCKSFAGTKALAIQDGSPLLIKRGAINIVLGPSGSGKSTFLSMLALLDKFDAGSEIRYHGRARVNGSQPSDVDYQSLADADRIRLRAREFGFAFQHSYLVGHMTAAENVSLSMDLRGVHSSESRKWTQGLTESVNLNHREKALPKTLSGGEKQRAALARALAHDPSVLFADEPTGNLDHDTGLALMDMIVAWLKSDTSRTVVLVTHDLHLAARYGDHFVLLEDGVLRHRHSRQEVLQLSPSSAIGSLPAVAEERLQIAARLNELTTPQNDGDNAPLDAGKVIPHHASLSGLESSWRRLRYTLVYAQRDVARLGLIRQLFPQNLFPLLTLFALFVAILSALVVLGLQRGLKETMERTANEDIRANRLEATLDPQRTTKGAVIDDSTVESLSGELKGIQIRQRRIWGKTIPAVTGVYPVAQCEANFYASTEGQSNPLAIGYTEDFRSPLFARLRKDKAPVPQALFKSNGDDGIIVTLPLLRRCMGVAKDAPITNLPDALKIGFGAVAGKDHQPIKLLAVVDDLPAGDFLLSSGTWQAMRNGTWRSGYRKLAISIPVGSDLDSLEAALRSLLSLHLPKATVAFDTETGKQFVLIDAGPDSQLSRPQWEDSLLPVLLNRLGDLLDKRPTEYDFRDPVALSGIRNTRPEYTALAIYVTDLGAAGPVADCIKKSPHPLRMDGFLIAIYHSMQRMVDVIAGIAVGFLGITILLSIIVVTLMFLQDALRKRHEIGILKAFGCSGLRMRTIYFVEAAGLVIVAFASARLVAPLIGGWISAGLASILEDDGKSVKASGLLVLSLPDSVCVFVVAFLLAGALAVSATSFLAKQQPNELLRSA